MDRSVHVELTDTQWMRLMRIDTGVIPVCCANIAHLREHIIGVAVQGGTFDMHMALPTLRVYAACLGGHSELADNPILTSFIHQIEQASGWSVDHMVASNGDHNPDTCTSDAIVGVTTRQLTMLGDLLTILNPQIVKLMEITERARAGDL